MDEDWSILLRPTVRRLLQALLEGPTSLTDLAEATALTKPALQRHLKDLERLGVVTRAYRPAGVSREVVYSLLGCSLHLEIRQPGIPTDPLSGTVLSWASSGYEDPEFPLTHQVPDHADRDEVAAILRGLRRNASVAQAWADLFIVLFGSIPKGEATRKSDIDLMIVLPSEDKRLREVVAETLADVQQGLAHGIQPFFTTRASFLTGAKRMDVAAANEGVVIHGARSERDLWSKMKRYRTISI